jgi:AAA+ ATPase superfamily predicted ATPase
MMPFSIMLTCIMRFVDRVEELSRLRALCATRDGGLAVVYGRRRIGKTRLLLEWVRRDGGCYSVADLSAPAVQRRHLASAVGERLPGFGEVEYPDWAALLSRLAKDAATARWRGPLVLDELPYLVPTSPELPSVLQRWVDHEAREARLVVAVAGSSQRMMQGLVLPPNAPLYARARVLLEVGPIDPRHLGTALGRAPAHEIVERYGAWGGVPRYWELAADMPATTRAQIERLVLHPLGPLHQEPDRLLIEEVPSALEVRPVLDAIGSGAHRVSEIAGRLARPATSLSRPLERLVGMRLVRRDVPFGEPERSSKKSLYRIDDPFFRLWFRVVAPNRAFLAAATDAGRRALLERHAPALLGEAWEQLCRAFAVRAIGAAGELGPARRWWRGNDREWDLVAESLDGKHLLLGEAKWHGAPVTRAWLDRACAELAARPGPDLGARYAGHRIVRALFVPALARGVRAPRGEPLVITLERMLR